MDNDTLPGAYSNRFKDLQEEHVKRLREQFHSDERGDVIARQRKLKQETIKRRQAAANRRKLEAQKEEKRRKAILENRHAQQKEATERFQRGNKTYKTRLYEDQFIAKEKQVNARAAPALEDALRAVRGSPVQRPDNSEAVSRYNSAYSPQNTYNDYHPGGGTTDSPQKFYPSKNVNRTVSHKNAINERTREHAHQIAARAEMQTSSLRNTSNNRSLFEQQLENHQDSIYDHNNRSLREFSNAVQQEVVSGEPGVPSNDTHQELLRSDSLSSVDSLEAEDSGGRNRQSTAPANLKNNPHSIHGGYESNIAVVPPSQVYQQAPSSGNTAHYYQQSNNGVSGYQRGQYAGTRLEYNGSISEDSVPSGGGSRNRPQNSEYYLEDAGDGIQDVSEEIQPPVSEVPQHYQNEGSLNQYMNNYNSFLGIAPPNQNTANPSNVYNHNQRNNDLQSGNLQRQIYAGHHKAWASPSPSDNSVNDGGISDKPGRNGHAIPSETDVHIGGTKLPYKQASQTVEPPQQKAGFAHSKLNWNYVPDPGRFKIGVSETTQPNHQIPPEDDDNDNKEEKKEDSERDLPRKVVKGILKVRGTAPLRATALSQSRGMKSPGPGLRDSMEVNKSHLALKKEEKKKKKKKGVRWTDLKYEEEEEESSDSDSYSREETLEAKSNGKEQQVKQDREQNKKLSQKPPRPVSAKVPAVTKTDPASRGPRVVSAPMTRGQMLRPKSGRPPSTKATLITESSLMNHATSPQNNTNSHNSSPGQVLAPPSSQGGNNIRTAPMLATESPSKRTIGNEPVYDQNGIRLDRTPTDDEINWLWDKVRTCLNRDPHREDSPRTYGSDQSAVSAPVIRTTNATPSKLIDGSTLNNQLKNMRVGKQISSPHRRSSSSDSLRLLQQRQQQGHNNLAGKQSAGGHKKKATSQCTVYQVPKQSNQGPTPSSSTAAPAQEQDMSESMAAFLTAEAMAAKQSVSESDMNTAMDIAQNRQTAHNANRPQQKVPTALSIEEQRLLQSLDRLNEKLRAQESRLPGGHSTQPLSQAYLPDGASEENKETHGNSSGFRGHQPLGGQKNPRAHYRTGSGTAINRGPFTGSYRN